MYAAIDRPLEQQPALDLHQRGVYLLHFDRPYQHAKHYTGYSQDIAWRVGLHRTGKGANMTKVIRAAGIGFTLARIWPGAGQTEERRLKNMGGAARYCPICKAAARAAREETR